MNKTTVCMMLSLLILLFTASCIFAESDELYSEPLEGRGRSDSGRSEPQYVGHRGYLTYYGSFSSSDDSCLDIPWYVPTYTKDKQFWVESGKVEHKTEVRVLWQDLEHEGLGRYSGMLQVERLDNGEQLYVDVSNFITKPYWAYPQLREASLIGEYVAEFNQVSDYYPVDRNNEKVELNDGMLVLVTGPTGTYGRNGPDNDTHPIEAMVFKKWKYGYGGVSVFFTEEDLTVIY